MEFSSFARMERYINSANNKAKETVAKEQVKIAKQEIQTQVYDAYTPVENPMYNWKRTNALKNASEANVNGDTIEFKIKNNGSWHSVYTGENVYALDVLDEGWTWGSGVGATLKNGRYRRPKTNIQEVLGDKMETKTKDTYIEAMRKKGIPIE